MKKKWIIIIAGIVVVGLALAIIGYNYVFQGQPDFADMEPEHKIRAKRLYTDFTENTELATERYVGSQGKMIQIEGPISKVELVDTIAVIVYSYNEGMFGDEGIRVTMLPQFTDEAKRLSKLKPVKVKGLCTGYNGTDVIMIHGSLVK